jgi:hypothetical protein
MSGHQKPLEALSKYFEIKRGKQQHELRCKICGKGWGVPVEKEDNFNPIGLFDHAFMHEDAKKPVEECIE